MSLLCLPYDVLYLILENCSFLELIKIRLINIELKNIIYGLNKYYWNKKSNSTNINSFDQYFDFYVLTKIDKLKITDIGLIKKYWDKSTYYLGKKLNLNLVIYIENISQYKNRNTLILEIESEIKDLTQKDKVKLIYLSVNQKWNKLFNLVSDDSLIWKVQDKIAIEGNNKDCLFICSNTKIKTPAMRKFLHQQKPLSYLI